MDIVQKYPKQNSDGKKYSRTKKETFYSFTDKMNLEYEMLSEALAVVRLFLLLSPNWPKCVAQLAVARLVCRPDDWWPYKTHKLCGAKIPPPGKCLTFRLLHGVTGRFLLTNF